MILTKSESLELVNLVNRELEDIDHYTCELTDKMKEDRKLKLNTINTKLCNLGEQE